MSGLEYLFGLVLLLVGFNLGYYEAGKGLSFEEIKKLVKPIVRKVKK